MQKGNVLEQPRTLAELFDGAEQEFGPLGGAEQIRREQIEAYLGTLGVSQEAQIELATLAGQIRGKVFQTVSYGLARNNEITSKLTPQEAVQVIVRLLSDDVTPSRQG